MAANTMYKGISISKTIWNAIIYQWLKMLHFNHPLTSYTNVYDGRMVVTPPFNP